MPRRCRCLVEEGPARVRELQTAGAHFDLDPVGRLKLGREAAHSKNRIVHAHGDQTGAEVARTLVARVRESRRIRVLERARVLDLIVRRGTCYGVRASIAGRATEIIADATVLATGGCGQIYRYTTNPVVATGDGYAIAHRAGVTLADMEFVQFHPTALDTPENPLALDFRGGARRGRDPRELARRAVHARPSPARRARAARRRGARDLSRAAQRPGVSRRAQARPLVREAVSGNLCALSGARHRSAKGSDSRDAGRALHDGRRRDRSERPVERRATLRGRRGRAHGRARREPARVELAARGARLRRARRARHREGQEVWRRRRARRSGRCLRSPIAAPRRWRPTTSAP